MFDAPGNVKRFGAQCPTAVSKQQLAAGSSPAFLESE